MFLYELTYHCSCTLGNVVDCSKTFAASSLVALLARHKLPTGGPLIAFCSIFYYHFRFNSVNGTSDEYYMMSLFVCGFSGLYTIHNLYLFCFVFSFFFHFFDSCINLYVMLSIITDNFWFLNNLSVRISTGTLFHWITNTPCLRTGYDKIIKNCFRKIHFQKW